MSENSGSVGYFTFSVIIHSAMAASLVLMPQLELLDEGSGHTIEFVAMEPPKGEQFETTQVDTKEIASPIKKPVTPPSPPQPEVKQPLKPKPTVKVAKPAPTLSKKEKVAKAPLNKTSIENKQTEKIDIDSLPQEPVEDKVDEFLAEQSELEDAPTSEAEPETSSLRTVAMKDVNDIPFEEEIEETEDKVAPIAKTLETEKEIERPFAAQAAPEESLPPQNPSPNSQARTISKAPSPSSPLQPQKQANQAYGQPSGKVRSYLDLRQVSGNRPPSYPVIARRQQQQGKVHLAYYVKSNGSVSNLRLVQSSGYPMLDQEAIRAVSKYRYQPGQAGWTIHPVNFSLQGPSKKMPSRLRTSSR